MTRLWSDLLCLRTEVVSSVLARGTIPGNPPRSLKERTGLDWPWLIATASRVASVPVGSVPAHPAGCLLVGSQAIVSTWGTPSVKRTCCAGAGLQAAESHIT